MRTSIIACLTIAFGACTTVNQQPTDGECGACTMEFRTVQVQVVDAAGTPLAGLDVVVTNERTGSRIDVDQESVGFGAGMYAVITDSNVDEVSEEGDRLHFRATDGTRVAEGTFVVGRDRCACHIVREEGPEQVVAR